LLQGQAIKAQLAISLANVRQSLEMSRDVAPPRLLTLTAADGVDARVSASFDVTDELCQLDIDLDFLRYVQSDAYDNLETFLHQLAKYHPGGAEEFARELDDAGRLLCSGGHFEVRASPVGDAPSLVTLRLSPQYFFSDRDGTLRSYACSYASSIQGAYSGVIQATFAQRCAQYAAIVTSAPLRDLGILDVSVMPDGCFCLGASGGREWYVNAARRFKDASLADADLRLLDQLADRLAALMEADERFRQFAWLGSCLQRHYGHVTVARQDVYGSIDAAVSLEWCAAPCSPALWPQLSLVRRFGAVCRVVDELDPEGRRLHVVDSGTDVKVHVKAKLSGQTFTKGHGIRLFAAHMQLDLRRGNALVMGDSETDLPMLKEVSCVRGTAAEAPAGRRCCSPTRPARTRCG